MSELRRVVTALHAAATSGDSDRATSALMADAARLLCAMAEDFKKHVEHGPRCPRHYAMPLSTQNRDCNCGLDAAREKWRLV